MSKSLRSTFTSSENTTVRSGNGCITTYRRKQKESLNKQKIQSADVFRSPAKNAALRPNAIRFPILPPLLLPLAAALDLAGHQWVPVTVFADLLAILTNLILFSIEFGEIDEPRWKSLGACLCVPCGLAIIAALL